jgi:hypothetical protein
MMDVRKGCVRVSVLDYRQNRVFWDRRDARLLNWDEVQETIWASARKTVDFSTLENWQEPAAFLRRQLLAILSDDSGSEPAGQNVRRIVVLICLDFGARPGSMIEVLSPNDRKGCQLYFFRLLPSSAPTGAPIGTRDGVVTEMLRRMRPRTLKFQDARELSNALSRFIGDLSK